MPYAELHCHSNFSFFDGVSHPEDLVEHSARLGLDALALTDHDGMYGAVRFAQVIREVGLRTIYGTELSLGLPAPQNSVTDPHGEHLLLLDIGRRSTSVWPNWSRKPIMPLAVVCGFALLANSHQSPATARRSM